MSKAFDKGAAGAAVLALGFAALAPVAARAQQLTMERTGDTCVVRTAADATGTPIDCALFDQASIGVQAMTGSGHFKADGVGDGSDDAIATGVNSVAAGANAIANGAASSAVGYQSDAEGDYATALGSSSLALGTGSTAVGSGANALGTESTATGYGSVASGEYAVANGSGANATANYAIAQGKDSMAMGDASIAIGVQSMALGVDSISMGAGSQASELGTAVGTLSYVGGFGSSAFGHSAFADGDFSLALGAGSTSTSTGGIAIGTDTYVDPAAMHGIAIGSLSTALGANSIAIGGLWTTAGADGAVAIGGTMACEGFMCIETNNGAWGINSTALGAGASAYADGATSVGAGSQAGGLTSASLGHSAYANADNALALGARAMVWAANAVAIGADSYADRENTVSVGNSWGMTRQIVNVADGTEANDAVNKQQLDVVDAHVTEVDKRVTNVEGRVDTLETQIGDVSGVVTAKLDSIAVAMGGGAMFDASGNMTAPSFSVGGGTYHNVGDTISAIDALLGDFDSRITQIEGNPGGGGSTIPTGTGDGLAIGAGSHAQDTTDTAIGTGATVSADNAVALGAGSVANEANTVSVGSAGNERRVTNVAAGTNATDAANVAQMQAGDAATLSAANTYTDGRLHALDSQISQLQSDVWSRLGEQDQRIDRNGAMSAAMMNMAINAAGARSDRGRVAVGAGWQNGENALSVGYSKAIGRATFSIGGAFTSDDQSVGAGFGVDL
ncbi:hypothetical protein LK996_14830 [Lysobacter sp. A6]|uniref:Trimeric autotransporter adhesin n=1 Tax=Noviluteimonas lactosilytica TaxID=2888523 RepID=A0ABS8JL99_9GAMM|nr:hypothetical protein [Lysobacter lactosilyticus]MCC8364347.1 hypothetical protein [Lysobacter lactosilyticus]